MSARRMTVLGLAMIVLALLAGWCATALGADTTGELRLDVWLTHHRPGWLRDLSVGINDGLGPVGAYVMIALVVLVLLMGGRRIDVLTEVAVFFAGWWSASAAKQLFQRARPTDPPVDRIVALHDSNSMPSGHTAIATGIVAALCVTWWLARGTARGPMLIGVVVVAVVGLSRMVVGAHYLVDVVVAAVLATGVILVLLAALTRWGRLSADLGGTKPLHRPRPPHLTARGQRT